MYMYICIDVYMYIYAIVLYIVYMQERICKCANLDSKNKTGRGCLHTLEHFEWHLLVSEARSQMPAVRSQKAEAERKARCQKLEAESQKPKARSQMPEAESQKPEAKSQKPKPAKKKKCKKKYPSLNKYVLNHCQLFMI